MPPRNSNTKPFRKYRNFNSDPSEKRFDDSKYLSDLNKAILNPEKCLNNKFYKDFNEYKNKRTIQGLEIGESMQSLEKEEGDLRYKNSEWYKSRAKGEVGSWNQTRKR